MSSDAIYDLKMRQNVCAAGPLLWTPLGKLPETQDPYSLVLETAARREGREKGKGGRGWEMGWGRRGMGWYGKNWRVEEERCEKEGEERR